MVWEKTVAPGMMVWFQWVASQNFGGKKAMVSYTSKCHED
jgi:hypothetical protein